MQILILSCNTGEGHNSTARAIAECFSAHGVASTIIDSLSFGIKGESKLISCGHNTIYKYLPHAFGAGYYLLEQKKSKEKNRIAYSPSSSSSKGERVREARAKGGKAAKSEKDAFWEDFFEEAISRALDEST